MLPNLRAVALHPVHLAINYEHAHFNKRTAGSRDLRKLLRKFNVSKADLASDWWGVAYTGRDAPRPDDYADSLRDMILDHSMSLAQAKAVLASVDPEQPWLHGDQFVQALAAHSAVHRAELNRRTHVAGQTLSKLLWNAAAPGRLQWYLNHLRAVHSMPVGVRALRGSGTSPNEAFHAELNGWLRNQPETYSSTVELQLQIGMHAKLLAHVNALRHPTLREARQNVVLARSSSALSQDPHAWREYCDELCISHSGISASKRGPLHARRMRDAALIRANAGDALRLQLRKPASSHVCGHHPARAVNRLQRKTSAIVLARLPRIRIRGKQSLASLQSAAGARMSTRTRCRKRTVFTLARSAWRRRKMAFKRPAACTKKQAGFSASL